MTTVRMRGLSIVLAAGAVAVAIAARLYHAVWHPEWTEAQVLRELAWMWGVVGLLAVGAVGASVASSVMRE